MEPRRVFYPALQHEDEGREEEGGGGRRWQLRFGLLSLQRWQTKYKLHIAAVSWWRVAVVWFGHSGGVDHVCEIEGGTCYLSYL